MGGRLYCVDRGAKRKTEGGRRETEDGKRIGLFRIGLLLIESGDTTLLVATTVHLLYI